MIVLSQKYNVLLKGILEIIPNVYQLTIGGVNRILIVQEKLTLVDAGFPGSTAQLVDFSHSLGRSAEEISLFSSVNKLLIVGDALNGRYQFLRLPPKMTSTGLIQAIDSVKRLAELDLISCVWVMVGR